jgi:hypothetical protein
MIITQEMARTMLMDSKLTDIFWTHVVHTTVHIQNRVMLINNNDKTPYELWKGSPETTSDKKKFTKDMQMNLKCHYLENYPSFWVFRYVKATKEFLFLKLSISEKC